MARGFLERLRDGEVLISWGPIHTLLEQESRRNLDQHLAERIMSDPDTSQRVLKALYDAGC
ncbi:unnamed protein product, partial [marine sediment metagenome]